MVNVNFSNVACSDVPAIFIDMEERYGVNFQQVEFETAVGILKQQCPTIFRNVTLKNANALYTANMKDVTCLEILNAVAEFDATAK